MAYRFTDTEKWRDAWFLDLNPTEKILFNYLCDNCDIAGFIELTPKKWAFEIGVTSSTIQGAIEGLSRGLIHSHTGDCIYIRTFLKHQKNLPLNEKNNAHIGIIKCFERYRHKFEIENIETFINQDVKPLPRGYGKGKGNSKGNDICSSSSIKESSINTATYRYSKHYDDQLEDNKENPMISDYEKFIKYLHGNNSIGVVHGNILGLKNQLKYSEFITLKTFHPAESLTKVVEAMENKTDLQKKYTSVYLTINNWVKNEKKSK